jgi:carbamoyltransferase
MHKHFDNVMLSMHIHEVDDSNHNDERTRAIIGYYVQSCLEMSLMRIISKYNMKNVYLSGGCFLNVKLNKVILDVVLGKVCVNPLSGDQGAAIGLFRRYTNVGFDFHDLTYGTRDRIELHSSTREHLALENIYIYENEEDFVESVAAFIGSGDIVNIMQHDMEFGPRALCNTSTLALPTVENSMYINKVNARNEVMPMAPVMLKKSSELMMKSVDLDRVIGSNYYMIITHDVAVDSINNYRGILHTKPMEKGFTCRPQIVVNNESNIAKILKKLSTKCLINTSFNTHGRPILHSFESAIHDFRKQKLNDLDDRLILILLNSKV